MSLGVRRDRRDRDQRESQIADLDQQAVQCRLIGNEPGEYCFAIFGISDAHAVEPLRPGRSQLPFHSNLVDVCHGVRTRYAVIGGAVLPHRGMPEGDLHAGALEQVQLADPRNRLVATVDAELLIDVLEVRFDGAWCDDKCIGNLGTRAPGNK